MTQDIAGTASAETAPAAEALRDGSRVLIRPMRKGDAAAERKFLCSLPDTTRRMRFLGQPGAPGAPAIEPLAPIDVGREAAFVARPVGSAETPIVGVARYGREHSGARCECAVVVDDHWQGKGLGTRLMEHLIGIARSRGIRTMYSVDAADDRAMADLARHLGFSRRSDPDDRSRVIHEIAL